MRIAPRLMLSLVVVGTTSGSASGPGDHDSRDVRLVVVVSVDQMRQDYLHRFDDLYTGGLKRLLSEGSVFTDAHQAHAATETGPGHSTILTGNLPSKTGIVGNAWRLHGVRSQGTDEAEVYCVGDARYPVFTGSGGGISPANLLCDTLGDWMKARDPETRVVSISMKDRSAVLLGGRRADVALWYDAGAGGFTTSRYYADHLPAWVFAFLSSRELAGRTWDLLLDSRLAYLRSRPDAHAGEGPWSQVFPHRLPPSEALARRMVVATPWMDEMTFDLSLAAVEHLHLGEDDIPDLLAVGPAATDVIGHAFGPYSVEIQDQLLRLDRMLGSFLATLGSKVGADRLLVVLTSDHGIPPLPEYLAAQGSKTARRVDLSRLQSLLDEALRPIEERLGCSIVAGRSGDQIYLDLAAIEKAGASPPDVARELAQALTGKEPILKVYDRFHLDEVKEQDPIARLVANAFHPDRCGDLFVVLEPHVVTGIPAGTTHGSPHVYDTHVPLVIQGPGIRPSRCPARVTTADIAPTLAHYLGIPVPDGLDGVSRLGLISSPRPESPASAPENR